MTTKKKPGFWERFATRELSRITATQPENELFLLSDEEIKSLKKIRNSTYWKVGLAGVLGVVLLYGPPRCAVAVLLRPLKQ